MCFEALVGLMVMTLCSEGNQTRVEGPGTYHENPGKTPGNHKFYFLLDDSIRFEMRDK